MKQQIGHSNSTDMANRPKGEFHTLDNGEQQDTTLRQDTGNGEKVEVVYRLSSGKKKHIQAWTLDVNEKMHSFNSGSKNSAKGKVHFPGYEPPGTPCDEPGFRRIAKPSYIKKSMANKATSPKGYSSEGLSYAKIIIPKGVHDVWDTADTYITQLKFLDSDGFSYSHRSCTRPRSGISKRTASGKSSRMSTEPNSQTSSFVKEKATEASVPVSDVTEEESVGESRKTQWGAKTTSNNLLNCVSIDDSFKQHRGLLSQTSVPGKPGVEAIKGAKCPSFKSQLSMTESEVREESESEETTNTGRSTRSSVSVNKKIKNKAVKKGFENLENTKEASKSYAFKGLYKFEKSCNKPLKESKGTKNFHQRNSMLHEMVAQFHEGGSTLARKTRRWGQVTTHSEDSGSRPQSGSTTSFMMAERFRLGRGNRVNYTIEENESLEAESKESFLELIMDMDKK